MAENMQNTKCEKKEFYKELFSLAVPIGLQNLLVALIGASDALMLGRLAQDAVSAVSLANQIVFIMNLFIGAIVGGGGVLIVQYWGNGDRSMAKNLFCMIIKWSFTVSCIFFALAMLMPQQLMRIFTPDKILIGIGADYLKNVGISYLFLGITQCYYFKMKVEGRAGRNVIISVAALITDVTLDFFLIYGMAGVPKLGADGSAYSTVAVEGIARFFVLTETAGRYLIGMLVFTAVYIFAYSINTVVVCGIFPAGGDARYDAVSVFVASWCFSLPLALLGTFVFHWQVMVIYVFMCADEIVTLPWLYARYKKYYWLNNLTRNSAASA